MFFIAKCYKSEAVEDSWEFSERTYEEDISKLLVVDVITYTCV